MINFKLRLQNKATLVALISAVFLMLQQFGLEIPHNIQEGVNTFVVILVILGIVTDPTTKGVADSERALNYNQPREDQLMAKLMTSINQIEGGDILKSGDVTSLFGFNLRG